MSVVSENHVIDLLPGYVLDVLTDEETNQVVEHLAACPSCQHEYHSLQAVAEDLPLALAQSTPSARVKANLMQAIHARQRTVLPVSQPSFGQKLVGVLRLRLPALGLALILLLALGNALLLRQLSLSQSATTSMKVVALSNTAAAPQAVGTLIMDVKGDFGTLVVDNFAVLDNSQQYQVWLTRDGERVSAGVFSVNPAGYASLQISSPAPLIQYNSIGITIEPYGGSPAPTGAKVMDGNIPR